jgi:DNA mismatch repair ATPase MutS
VELELLSNRKFNTLEESLISLFDTKTLSGARLLRSNFLQAPAVKSEICLRQISVEELIDNKETLLIIREKLKNFKDMEIFNAKFSQRINDPTENNIRQILFAINGLREALKQLNSFAEIIRLKLSTEYFMLMLKCFQDSALANILSRIDEFLDDIDLQSIKISKKQDLILFMVKPSTDNVLDVSRKVYSDTIEEIYAEFESIKAASNDPHIKLLFNEAKGFYVSINENFYCEKDFDVAKKEGKKYNCANIALLSYSQRIKEIKKDIIDISFKIVFEIYEMIQKNLSFIHIACSYIALMDVLCAFAFYALNTKTICKPIILDNNEPWAFFPEKTESSDCEINKILNSNSNNFKNNLQYSNKSSILNSEYKSSSNYNYNSDYNYTNINNNNKNISNKYSSSAQAQPKSYLIGKNCFHPVLEKGNIILSVYNTNEDNLSSYNNRRKKNNFGGEDKPKKFIPNDYFISDLFNFLVIRGANASGKTTYMKQLALLVILAQCGCYVPCDYFKFSLRKYLFTKFDCSDSMEDNKGSFVRTILEIQKMITNNVSYPLFLLDEPFDNSEHMENLCITLSIIDKINEIKNTPFLVVSSHNSNLNLLSSLYTNILIGNMEVEFKRNSLNFLYKFDFTNPLDDLKNKKNNDLNKNEDYKVLDSQRKDDFEYQKTEEAKKFSSENYGIILADMLGFPKEMINVRIFFLFKLIKKI